MERPNPERHWMVEMTQARHFAERENYLEATARVADVLREVKQALAVEQDGGKRARLERMLQRAEREHATFRAQFEAWRVAVEAGRQARTAHAADEMARPLPARDTA